ncbi:hypothetical protein [Sinorhizobium meliloti]|uniref:hypothetical protein n=1 Tax=Rhizobium meliloti TaxID=382 RepID=UPI000FD763D1|nr:hypothetical protein [Sinorhizobium meliloti]MDW9928083.1 hypothetical protein [Sinorhizobium meliloti]MDX0966390.1 hypothetical protein [Sinorhizobium medicae]RVI52568.1 hypothetical protein CN195_10960 [Sinorhizobium meliloti]
MAKNEHQESYEKLLSANRARMIDSVKFAGTKNAALLTSCSVRIGVIIDLLTAARFPALAEQRYMHGEREAASEAYLQDLATHTCRPGSRNASSAPLTSLVASYSARSYQWLCCHLGSTEPISHLEMDDSGVMQ